MNSMNVEPIAPYLEPLEKTVTVACAPAHAFRVFTHDLGKWWPLSKGFNVSGPKVATCTFEERLDGAIFETDSDGVRAPWGRVLAWEPPRRVVFSWHPGKDPSLAQEVEVRFEASGGATRVTLTHRDWQKLGAEAAKMHESYNRGWGTVLGEHFVAACA